MRILRPARAERVYEVVIVPEDDPDAWEWYQAIRSAPERAPGDAWRPVPLVVTHPITGRKAARASVPWTFPEVLVVRDEAIESLGQILSAHGELLPVDGKNATLAMFVAPLVDEGALIDELSETTRTQPWSEDITIEHGVFDVEVLGGRQAFTVRTGRNLQLLLREDLVEELLATGDVAGVAFEPIGTIGARGVPE
ncbi:hypothetical protein [Myceligenerans pegani]|uniref:Uncharacterized protein n=1 Tax=Myceligenerans pegani TaxID=2776917 RepID=A0ABR9MUX9_9MICO|nr:hypothetical protein [Myceligenerans sp. TRM 65318]MBE1874806.1 hypothetical protein [Myceligenerans sp. TRM 65318]MBE3017077.1 hypothetical protein [Myceligenerans sp. TRM 65318]